MRITLGANSKQCEQENFRERERGEGEQTNRMVKINTSGHGDLFPEVRFERTYSPVEEATKDGSISILSLSQLVT
jgi:hypothetical protein